MWEVVKRTRGKEQIVAGPLSYSEAYAQYETLAVNINAVDAEGNYNFPHVRISVRKVAA